MGRCAGILGCARVVARAMTRSAPSLRASSQESHCGGLFALAHFPKFVHMQGCDSGASWASPGLTIPAHLRKYQVACWWSIESTPACLDAVQSVAASGSLVLEGSMFARRVRNKASLLGPSLLCALAVVSCGGGSTGTARDSGITKTYLK